MYNSSCYDVGDSITVNFVDEKGFDCDIEGEVIRVYDDSVVCNATDMDSVIRFRVSFADDVVVKLLLDDNEFQDSVVSYDVSKISRNEESDLEQLLNQIDEDELGNIGSVNDRENGDDLNNIDIGGDNHIEKDFDTSVQQDFSI